LGYDSTNKEVTYYNLTAPATSTFTITALTANTLAQTLTVNFNSYLYGVGSTTVSSATAGTTSVTAYSFSNAVIGGTYTIAISIQGTGAGLNPTLTVSAQTSTTNRCNFASVTVTTTGSATVSQTNPKYILLTVTYDGTRYYISASGFNN
jgi:hypothetical protein